MAGQIPGTKGQVREEAPGGRSPRYPLHSIWGISWCCCLGSAPEETGPPPYSAEAGVLGLCVVLPQTHRGCWVALLSVGAHGWWKLSLMAEWATHDHFSLCSCPQDGPPPWRRPTASVPLAHPGLTLGPLS